MIQGISHVGIAVNDIESIVMAFSKALNITTPPIYDNTENKIKVAMIELNGIGIELLEEYSDKGMLKDFVREKGNGIHHLCFKTDNINEDVKSLKNSGFSFKQEAPSLGVRGKLRIFTTDDALDGIPFELTEP